MNNSCTTKDTIKRMKRQATDGEKILAKDTSDKGKLCKIQEELLKLNNIKANNLVKKIGPRLNRHLTKEDVHMENKHMNGVPHHMSSGICKSKQ